MGPSPPETASSQATSGSASGRVLVIGDDPSTARVLRRVLETDGHRVEALPPALAGDALHRAVAAFDPAVLVLAPGPLRAGGLARVGGLKAFRPGLEIVVLAREASVEGAVLYMRRGASDYLASGFADPDRLRRSVRRALAGTGVQGVPSPFPGSFTIPLSLEAYERHALERALLECGGDAAGAARRLGIGRSTLYRKLARHGLRARSGDEGPTARRAAPEDVANAVGPPAGVGGGQAIR